MSTELSNAIAQIAEEKNLSVESIVETIELALAAAYRKDFGHKQQNIKVEFDLETGNSRVFDIKQVVDDELVEKYLKEKEEREKEAELNSSPETGSKNANPPKEILTPEETKTPTNSEADNEEEEEEKFNPKTMIGLKEAIEIQAGVKVGEEIKQELDVPADYGRMAAQTAKQVIIQKIREAEREMVFDTFKEKEHQLVNGMIQRVEPRVVLVDMDSATGIMPQSEQINGEFYRIGGRFKFYIKEVGQTPKGPEIIVSRAHPEVIRKLLAIEVPEIDAGSVVIKSIAREAGARSKIAVMAKEENIDPIGSCVGQRGSRVQTIINELGGEKIDIIEYDEDPAHFIANSLSPAKILRVDIDEEQRLGRAFVKADQLSLAIGKGGQNVRLAAKLTGWRIDVVDGDSGEIKESGTDSDVAAGKSVPEDTSSANQEKTSPDTDGDIDTNSDSASEANGVSESDHKSTDKTNTSEQDSGDKEPADTPDKSE